MEKSDLEITYEEAIAQVKAKFEEVLQEMIKRDREKAIKQIKEKEKQLEQSSDSFVQGICLGLKIAQMVLACPENEKLV